MVVENLAATASSLLSLEHRDQLLHTVGKGLFQKDNSYNVFRPEDATAWIMFICVFIALIAFDNVVLHRHNRALSVVTAFLYALFWIACASAFCAYVYFRRGANPAFNWVSGYLLEWMLSFDNLFVFHLVFSIYATPDHLKHRPLFLGVCGAVCFRLVFFFIGEYMMHAVFLAHFIFGAFLVYTGFKSATMNDDEEDDPSTNPIVRFLSRNVPFVSAYDSRGSFFVRVPVKQGQTILPEGVRRNSGLDIESFRVNRREVRYGTVDFASPQLEERDPEQAYQWRATMLFLVVCCLEVTDLLFAVDSVSAIIAQVPDLFLAFTSAVFAMLGLRATFFIIDILVKIFSLLKYGVSAVLIFVGVKLMISKLYTFPPGPVCCILFLTLSMSMMGSVVHDHYLKISAQLLPEASMGKSEGAQLVAKIH